MNFAGAAGALARGLLRVCSLERMTRALACHVVRMAGQLCVDVRGACHIWL